MKIVLIFTLLIAHSASIQKKELNVATRTHAVVIKPGFALKDEDIIINFKGGKYLVWSKEYFNQTGEIDSLIENHDIDYLHWSRKEMYKLKDFFSIDGFTRYLTASLANSKLVKINNYLEKIIWIDVNKKEIFYRLKNERNGIYIISYR